MNPDLTPEEGQLYTQTLSPVSPKPLRFPDPSTLPVLENQMDLAFNDTATYAAVPEPILDPAPNTTSATPFEQLQKIDMNDGHDPVVDKQAAAGSGPEHDMSVVADSTGQNTAPAAIASHMSQNSSANHAPLRSSDVAYAPNGEDPLSSSESDMYDDDGGVAVEVPPQSIPDQQQQYDGSASPSIDGNSTESGAVDLQALIDNIAASAKRTTSQSAHMNPASAVEPSDQMTEIAKLSDVSVDPSIQSAADTVRSPTLLPPAAASLPPRPPTQASSTEFPLESDLRQYHPHEQNVSAPKYPLPLGASLQLPGSLPPLLPAAGAPGTTVGASGLPPPPIATFQQQPAPAALSQLSPTTSSAYPNGESQENVGTPQGGEDEDIVWTPELQQRWDEFIPVEREYETKGEWDAFPPNSRLFVGNLASEKVSKRDLFAVFHKFGGLAQISIKQAYGFVQYQTAEACKVALDTEQNVPIRGRRIHLEFSKPPKNNRDRNNGDNRNRNNRRSRSPERGGGNANRVDRYRNNNNNGNFNNNDNRQRNAGRVRDDYRPGRSPSPRRGGYRARSPDMYNGGRRSRSRSPMDGRYRNHEQRADNDDDCPLPRRDPRDVPDVQIIAKDNPDRNFMSHVERSFDARGIKADVLLLSSRLSEASVMRRQIVEGVLAVLKVNRMTQMTQKFDLVVFDRSAGVNQVKFDEYQNQDLAICVELANRAKQTARMAAPQYTASTYATSQFGLPVVQPPPPQSQPQLYGQQPYQQQQRPPSSIPPYDPSALQQLLGRVQQPPTPTQHQPPQFPPASSLPYNAQQGLSSMDLSRLLAAATPQQQQQQQNPYGQPQQNHQQQNPGLAGLASNPALATLLANVSRGAPQGLTPGMPQPPNMQQQQRPGQPDMSSIMAQLARYGQ